LSVRQQRFVALVGRLRHEHPHIDDPEAAIAAGDIRVDGVIVTNPRGLVRRDASIAIAPTRSLRGSEKLDGALDAFGVSAADAVALDMGASTGGFTSVLLARGARRVYAVDAGYGQLRGSLRQDPRVVNLERTNVGSLSVALIDQPIDVGTMDLSYLALANAVPGLDQVCWQPGADLLALVKPMYELGLARPPVDEETRRRAIERAAAVMTACGWDVQGWVPSSITGRRGAIEYFLHARHP
jgi:23S rRNA (cytidine1920-2'-O)/16S rRNA (cytidine1409-2'-O)-methyltransferase